MRRLIDFLAPLGIVLAAGAWVWRAYKPLPGGFGPYLAVAGVLVVAHLLLRWEDIVHAIGGRQLAYGANMAVLIVALLGILGFANYLIFKNTKRWDFTKGQRYSLSDQTKKLLGSLQEDVKVLYFQRKGDEMNAARARMLDYELASSRVKVEYVDPLADPAKARAYEITAVPTLVLVRGARQEKISSDGEQDVTNALLKLTRDTKKTVCFLEGEGERDIDESGELGLSTVKEALVKNQYETKKVLLLRENRIPDECTVFVVAGPQKDLRPEEVETIRGWVAAGGKALVMVEPELKEPFPNVVALLTGWNFLVGNNIVLDVSLQSQLAGTGPFTPLVTQYSSHEITRDIASARLATAFHSVRTVGAPQETKPGTNVQSLVETSGDSWAESELGEKALATARLDVGQDTRGPVPLGAAATLDLDAPAPSPAPSPSPSPSPDTPKRQARVVAFGDSDFATNSLIGFFGNKDLVLNAVAWLAQDSDLIAIRAKEPDDQKLLLTRGQQQLVFVFALLFVPGLSVAFGIVSWWRRR